MTDRLVPRGVVFHPDSFMYELLLPTATTPPTSQVAIETLADILATAGPPNLSNVLRAVLDAFDARRAAVNRAVDFPSTVQLHATFVPEGDRWREVVTRVVHVPELDRRVALTPTLGGLFERVPETTFPTPEVVDEMRAEGQDPLVPPEYRLHLDGTSMTAIWLRPVPASETP